MNKFSLTCILLVCSASSLLAQGSAQVISSPPPPFPGQIFSRLLDYDQALYELEAASRIAHAQARAQNRSPVYEPHFARDTDAFIEHLMFTGQFRRAISEAKYLAALPRHPQVNEISNPQHASFRGRARLAKMFHALQNWDEAKETCLTGPMALDPASIKVPAATRLHWTTLACAAAMTDSPKELSLASAKLQSLTIQQTKQAQRQQILVTEIETRLRALPADSPTQTKFRSNLSVATTQLIETKKQLDACLESQRLVQGYVKLAAKEFVAAHELLQNTTIVPSELKSELKILAEQEHLQTHHPQSEQQRQQRLGPLSDARQAVQNSPQQVLPMARLVYLLEQNHQTEEANKMFDRLRHASHFGDSSTKVISRLSPIAERLGLDSITKETWHLERPTAVLQKIAQKPKLEKLGPLRLAETTAPQWILQDGFGKPATSMSYEGQAYLLILYLGHGCLHCAEQLHAFAPRVKDFQQAGIEMIAISTDDAIGLQKSVAAFSGEMPIRLAANGEHDVFKAYKAYKKEEEEPLHGTFLISPRGKILWREISKDPFMEHQFLLDECQRLLRLDERPTR